ncbi:alpha/beta hydrolase [Conexibacter sp. JD483]|uniref:alpha/beta fold hydrolase n=1 Tax=unclassified Conexibacter TaxID=2627773 RepID=UPI00271F808D|nr:MULTISPECIES: alpha/beta hydrolase [unclassified Conexibacter]MDO8185224.1 alpha/beta hydrolase [Conexibacter sp. CPCC 205706]MDO8198270.1 alpha/beta hydrolase [Conexibacter sp. CPCC 205762]MDR9367768.1 alpha/beta hydrolase [Conexibacter sp. JD483]
MRLPRPRTRRLRIVVAVALGLLLTLLVVNWTWGRLPAEPARSGTTARVGEVDLRWIEHDPPAAGAPAVLLLHGLPGTAEDLEQVAKLLPAYRTIAVDRPGYGFSSGGHHDVDAQLDTLTALLDRERIDQAIVVGHSYGGTLALALAERAPERVRALVLVDAAAAGDSTAAADRAQARFVQALSLPLVQPLSDLVFGSAVRKLSAQQGARNAFAPDPVDPAYEHRLLSETMRHEDLDAYAGELLKLDDTIDVVDAGLARVNAPAVVIQARDDGLVAPAVGARLARGLPRARLVTVPGGHMVPLVHPAVVAEAVRACAAGCGTNKSAR